MRTHNNKNYLLLLLVAIFAFNNVDRLVLALTLQDIKIDLHLSDTQLGLLSGIAFAFFYAVAGIPIARWADRGNRVVIISLCTALWSVAAALCGFAANFLQLLLIRMAAAVGEAGCVPPSHSLITSYFTRPERPRAFSRYMLAIPIGVIIGWFLGGWLNQFYGWRTTFLLLGLPGLVLAALAWSTVREPRQGGQRADSYTLGDSLSSEHEAAGLRLSESNMKDVCMVLWTNVTFRNLLFGYSLSFLFGSGIQQWQATFFIRSFGLNTGELGGWLTLIGGVCGFFGTYLGGELSARHASGNERRQLQAVAIAYCGYGVISIFAFLSHNYHVTFLLMAIAAVLLTAVLGPLFATIQTIVPANMRAVSIAVVYLVANVVGGLGPVAAGILSDALAPHVGNESLRYALVILWPGYFGGAWYLWRASQTVGRHLAEIRPHHNNRALKENEIPVSSRL
jgi:MFS transporter, Spinster family, sphingosine-1-phosphate transporter